MINVVFQRLVSVEVVVGAMSNNAFEYPLVAGDTGPKLRFTLLDTDRAVVGVSGDGVSGIGPVNLYLRRFGDQANSNVGHEACSGVDPANGIWDYHLQDGDISGAGTYFGDVQVTYDDGTVETAYEAVRFLVRSSNRG